MHQNDDAQEFKLEALEMLDSAEKSLLSLEAGEPFSAHYDNLFRVFHNIKGSASMHELDDLQAHVHEMESVLMSYQPGDQLPADKVELFIRGCDCARSMLTGAPLKSQPLSPAQSNEPGSGTAASSASLATMLINATDLLLRHYPHIDTQLRLNGQDESRAVLRRQVITLLKDMSKSMPNKGQRP